jgi:hypothetical protein
MRKLAAWLIVGALAGASFRPSVTVVAVGSAPTEGPASIVFAQKSDPVVVRVSNLPWTVGRVQLAHRTGDRDWVVAGSPELVTNGSSEFHFPLPAGCASNPMEVVALVAAAGIPKGHLLSPADLSAFRYVSAPVLVSCAAETGTVRIVSISNLSVSPDRELHVRRIEQVKAAYEGAPSGAFCQPIVMPDESSGTVWAMDDWRVTRPGSALQQFTTFFGRAPTSGARERDLFRTFVVYVVLTRRAFPVRGELGMTPAEFNGYARSIIAISRPIRVIRSLTEDGLSIRIESLGSADFGDRFLAHRVERVEGSVAAGSLYRAPKQPETVALLIRRTDGQAYWEVAGLTILRSNDPTRWVITLADLAANSAPNAAAADAQSEYRAMAVVLAKPVPLKSQVTESMLDDALAISDEVRYHVIRGGK